MQYNCINNITLILRDFMKFLAQNTSKLAIYGCFGPILCTQNFEIGLKLSQSMQGNCTNDIIFIWRDFMKFLAQNTPKLPILGHFGPFLGDQDFQIGPKVLTSMQCNCTSNMTLILRDFMKFLRLSEPKQPKIVIVP